MGENNNCPLVRNGKCNIPQIKGIFKETGIPCYAGNSCTPCLIAIVQEAINEHYDLGKERVVIPENELPLIARAIENLRR